MANKFVTAIFGDYSKKEVKKVKKTADKVLALEEKYASMSDKELTSQTDILKGRLANGETLDDILPDAFAVCQVKVKHLLLLFRLILMLLQARAFTLLQLMIILQSVTQNGWVSFIVSSA